MKNKDFKDYKLNDKGVLEGFDAVGWSRKVKRETGKQWTDKDGNIDRKKLKKILAQQRRKYPGGIQITQDLTNE